jgi:hypothetical protein
LHGDGEAERAGFGFRKPEGLDLDRRAKIGNPNRLERLAGSSVVVSVGLLIFASPSSQGFPATKHQGVFPTKKIVSEANPIPVRTTKVTKEDKLSFFGIFFFSFRRIKEKIKEKIEKDYKE